MTFPPSLPEFLQRGYAYTLDPGIARTKLQNGTSRTRKRASQRTVINVSINVSIEEQAVLEVFIRNDAYNWFDAGVIVDGEITTKTVRLISQGQSTYTNGRFETTMTLELYQHTNELDSMTAEEREVYYYYSPNDIADAVNLEPFAPIYGLN